MKTASATVGRRRVSRISCQSVLGGRVTGLLVGVLLVIHASLLAWGAVTHSPNLMEVVGLPAGLSHLQFGRFELAKVNPPLVRMIAAIPVTLAGPETDWESYYDFPGAKSEADVGRDFLEVNGSRLFWLFTLARWACIPFSLLGGFVCYLWAEDLFGKESAVLALVLWCFSPNILAHGQTMNPDVACAALGVSASYLFWHWLKKPGWLIAFTAGLVFGLGELAKSTLIVLFVVWPLLWLLLEWGKPARSSRRMYMQHASQLGTILVLGLFVINLGYGFEGSFKRLDEYTFVSETLAGSDAISNGTGNRFAGTWLGTMPVPLPVNYIRGADLQKRDFENRDGKWDSYLGGQWRDEGRWYYYIYGLIVKVPLGTWVLFLLAILWRMWRLGAVSPWRDEFTLVVPLIVILIFVSAQTGVNLHFRYVLLIFPFAFVWISQIAQAIVCRNRWFGALGTASLIWFLTSSICVYPHSLSYFNELVGGPRGGHAHMISSSIDWGQDLLYLRTWINKHPEASAIEVAYWGPVDPELAGIKIKQPPSGVLPDKGVLNRSSNKLGPKPGWYAVSVNFLRARDGRFAYFLRLRPRDMAGYSIYIYHITHKEANRVRKELGFPELSAADPF